MDLSDLRIVVTGAASGMGKHFATELARGGASVAACDQNEEGLAAVREEAGDLAGRIETFACDVTDESSVEQTFEAAWSRFGSLNGLINNAGIFRDGLLVKRDKETGRVKTMSREQWQQVLDVDLTGPFLCTRELARRMVEAELSSGVIVNVSSVARAGNIGQGNYSAAKEALVADTVTWAKELARYGIRVTAVAPGFVQTPILDAMKPEMLDKMVQGIPLKRLGTPDEVWKAVRFVLECDYFTGRCVEVDGGLRI